MRLVCLQSQMTSTTIQIDSLFDRKFEKDGDDFVIRLPAHKCDLSLFDPGSPVVITLEQGGHHEATDVDSQPPVEEGETLNVDIEELGRQGDGIAFVEESFVVFVPETDVGDSVMVQIDSTDENFAHASVVEDQQQPSTEDQQESSN